MPYEEIQVRIDRDGWVWVDTRGLPAEHVRRLCDHLEEVFGPRVREIADPTVAPRQTINLSEEQREAAEESLTTLAEDEERQREEARRRLRA